MSSTRSWDKMLTVITNCVLAGLIIASASACSSPEKDAYARLAREINPILTAMQSAASRLLAASPEDHAEIVAACWSVDDSLRLLRSVNFDREHIRPSAEFAWPSDYPKMLFELLPYSCAPDRPPESCSKRCRERWISMIAAVERVRVAARAEGVEIVSLDPSPAGSPR